MVKYLKLFGFIYLTVFICLSNVESADEASTGKKEVGIIGAESPFVWELGNYNCYVYKKHVVHTIPSEGVGEDIKVFTRTDKNNAQSDCKEAALKEKLHIRNKDAFWFSGISGDHLFIDNGTAPDGRELIVYDLLKKKKVFSSRYLGAFALQDKNTLCFYKAIKKIQTIKECPKSDRTKDIKDWLAQGQSVALAERITLDLKTLKPNKTGMFLCIALQ